MLNNYFDRIYCINLERRVDRKESCQKKFSAMNMDVEFFPATDGHNTKNPTKLLPGEYGAAMSHIAVVEKAKGRGFERILILEDDIEFADDFNDRFKEYYEYIPPDWQLLYCGANHERPCRIINEHAARCMFSYTLHFVGISSAVFDSIIDLKPHIVYPIDVHYAMLQQFYRAYVTIPHIAFQECGFSDIQQSYVDYEVIRHHDKKIQ